MVEASGGAAAASVCAVVASSVGTAAAVAEADADGLAEAVAAISEIVSGTLTVRPAAPCTSTRASLKPALTAPTVMLPGVIGLVSDAVNE